MSPPPKKPDYEMMPFPVALLAAALKQFGAGMLVAAVFAAAIIRIYSDLERKNDILISLVKEQTEAAREVAANLELLIHQLEK